MADDHPVFRMGLKGIILEEYPYTQITEVNDGQEALERLKSEKFDIAILDIDMPKASGMDVLDYISEEQISVRPVILTMHNNELFFNESFDKGCQGFLLKEDSSIEIIKCIQLILEDTPFVSRKLRTFLKNREQFTAKSKKIKEKIELLTKSEFNTLKLVAQNKTSKEIAELLFVTEKSVENYRSRICKKLEISGGSNTLFRWAQENQGFIS